jgi:hypothetical protein
MTKLEYKKKIAELSLRCLEDIFNVTMKHMTSVVEIIPPDDEKDEHELMVAGAREKVYAMDHALKMAKKMKKMAENDI